VERFWGIYVKILDSVRSRNMTAAWTYIISKCFGPSWSPPTQITKHSVTIPNNTSYNVAKHAQLNSCLNSNYNLCFVAAWIVTVVAARGRFMRCVLLINQSMLTPTLVLQPGFSTKRDGGIQRKLWANERETVWKVRLCKPCDMFAVIMLYIVHQVY
jgi:hypothetical protein